MRPNQDVVVVSVKLISGTDPEKGR
jgi:hypothetical protein